MRVGRGDESGVADVPSVPRSLTPPVVGKSVTVGTPAGGAQKQ
jgi:hypothetical protein